jgi:hypothetical protein
MPVSSIPRQSLTAEVCANFGLEIGRLAMRAEETGKVLQSQESLLRRAQKAEMQPEAWKSVVPLSLIAVRSCTAMRGSRPIRSWW